jgi:hypothetical protein
MSVNKKKTLPKATAKQKREHEIQMRLQAYIRSVFRMSTEMILKSQPPPKDLIALLNNPEHFSATNNTELQDRFTAYIRSLQRNAVQVILKRHLPDSELVELLMRREFQAKKGEEKTTTYNDPEENGSDCETLDDTKQDDDAELQGDDNLDEMADFVVPDEQE